MAACQSLTKINGVLIGDPQEEEIFNNLHWEYQENDNVRCKVCKGDVEITLKNLYYFSPVTKRMGVVVEKNGRLGLHIKGAPEAVVSLCKNAPLQLDKIISRYAAMSYRILACAYKDLDDYSIADPLEIHENGLEFLGLILLQNQVKSSSLPIITELKAAKIRCIMSTGDSIATASSIGIECGIIPKNSLVIYGDLVSGNVIFENLIQKHIDITSLNTNYILAVTGALLEHMYQIAHPNLDLVIERASVFGRMSPNQKVLLIELLQKNDIMVAMVGDGANDCGALKAADVGLSLSEAESSIAAPFSGKELKGIIDVIKEGRASLVTCFQSFKFIMMYSLIQFTVVNILYLLNNNMLDPQYLFQDLFLILPLAVFMAFTGAYDKLAVFLPPGALISVSVIASLIGHLLIVVLVQTFGYYILTIHHFYEETDTIVSSPQSGHSNTVLFLISTSQLLIVAVSFNVGPPFRKPAIKNYLFTISAIIIALIDLYLIFMPDDAIGIYLGLVDMPLEFKLVLSSIILVGFFLSFSYERVLTSYLALNLKSN